jgi:hypothetical protein
MSEQEPVAWALYPPLDETPKKPVMVFQCLKDANDEAIESGCDIVPLYRQSRWIPITEQLPPEGERVLFYLDDPLTEVNLGWWEGKHTHGKAIAMEYGDADGDWLPCSHWMSLPTTTSEQK